MMIAVEPPVLAMPAQAAEVSVLSKTFGDKLVRCSFVGENADAPIEIIVLSPVVKPGEFGYRDGKDALAPGEAAYIDRANILRGMKFNVIGNDTKEAIFLAGAVVSANPVGISILPNEVSGGAYAATLKSGDGKLNRNGRCSVEAGTQVRAKFEAMK